MVSCYIVFPSHSEVKRLVDFDPVVALDKVFELAGRLGELMHGALAERGLSPARAEMLFVLHEGGPVVQRQLSEALRCTPRHITTLVDDLEAEGLVMRRPHPSDRRATLVVLTERGAAAAARMAAERQEAARWLLGDVPLAHLTSFVAVADQVLERIAAALPTPALSEAQSDAAAEAPGAPARRDNPRQRPSRTTSKRASAEREQR